MRSRGADTKRREGERRATLSFWIMMAGDSLARWRIGKKAKLRPWTTGDIRMLKTLAREYRETAVIARKLKRTLGGTKRQAMRLGVTLGGGRGKRKRAE
jgi:hypothetical protein